MNRHDHNNEVAGLKLHIETLEEALQQLLDAIPPQTNDCDWWGDDLTGAIKNAEELLGEVK